MKPTLIHLLLILGLVGAAFFLRLSAAIVWQGQLQDERALAFPDSHSYWLLGQRLARGQSYEYGGPDFRIFRAPGYPWLLAAMFRCLPEPVPVVWIRAGGACLGAITVAGMIYLGWLLVDLRTGYVAGFLATIYPGAIGMSVLILSEALFCPLMIGQLISWTAAWNSHSRGGQLRWAAAAGVLAGLATLTRPSWLLFTPFAIGLAVLFRGGRRRHVALGLWIMLAMILTMSPWWIRNVRLTGEFVPTTLQVGASLYDGLNPRATGGSDMKFARTFYEEQRRADEHHPDPEGIFESRLNRRLRDAALSWASQHPRRVIQLMYRKFIRMWNIWPNANEFQARRVRWLIAVSYLPFFLLACWGGWRFGRRGWPYVLCLLPAIYFTLLHLVFVSSIRYRQPAILALLALAAAAIVVPRGSQHDAASSSKSRCRAAADG